MKTRTALIALGCVLLNVVTGSLLLGCIVFIVVLSILDARESGGRP